MSKLSRLNIDVEQKDIDRALRKNSSKCVVATAVARAIPEATRIDVDMQTIRFSFGEKRLVYLTPWRVQDYIIGFDAGDRIEPFRFHIRDPQVTTTRAAKREAGEKRQPNLPQIVPGETPSSREATRQGGRVPPRGQKGYRTHTRKYGHRMFRVNREAAAGAQGPA